jgi:hypothetical protein
MYLTDKGRESKDWIIWFRTGISGGFLWTRYLIFGRISCLRQMRLASMYVHRYSREVVADAVYTEDLCDTHICDGSELYRELRKESSFWHGNYFWKIRVNHPKSQPQWFFFLNFSSIFFCIIFISLQNHLNSHDTIRRVNVQCSKF